MTQGQVRIFRTTVNALAVICIIGVPFILAAELTDGGDAREDTEIFFIGMVSVGCCIYGLFTQLRDNMINRTYREEGRKREID